jgi:hypothetical protein
MTCDDKKSDDMPREFPVEVKVGRTKVTVTLQLSPRVEVAVKETKIETSRRRISTNDAQSCR